MRPKLLVLCLLLASAPLRAEEAVSPVEAIQRRLVEVREKVAPAVVSISAIGGARYSSGNIYEDPFDIHKKRFFGEREGPEPRRNVGSGVIIDPGGFVLTNHHVVENTQQIFVTLSNGKTYKARLLGSDPSVDLAVLKIDAKVRFTAIKWVDPATIHPGQFALAFGNPWGLAQDPQPTVTLGIISAVNRSIRIGRTRRRFVGLIQTDAAINPGNSGGPLVDINGRMLGINTAIFSTTGGYQGIGFAVPISADVAKIIERLKKGHEVKKPHVGMVVSKLEPEKARLMKFTGAAGIIVDGVERGGPAAHAGLKVGDIITAVDGKAMTSAFQMVDAIRKSGAGRKLILDVFRDGATRKLPLTIGSLDSNVLTEPSPRFWRGLSVQFIRTGPNADKGVLVDEILPDTPAWRAGVREGDVVTKVNNLKITSPADFRDAIKGTEDQDVLLVTSGGVKIVKKK